MKNGQLYRARKAMEWKWTRNMTNQEIADELGVTRKTVRKYLNDPPEELKEPAQHFKRQLIEGTMQHLREQLAAATERARNAERTSKVFATDEDGNLETERIHFEDGGSKLIPKVEDYEFAPNHEVRAASRREAREIIQMLWNLTGAEEPDELNIGGDDENPLNVVVNRERYEDD
jgi:predicted transcriptional regulator